MESDDFESPLDFESDDEDDPESDGFESPPDFDSPDPPSLLVPLPGLFPL